MQQEYNNNVKYWYYRNRLRYFVLPVANVYQKGGSMVSDTRNKYLSDVISYADQMMYFGYYLGVLATEYKLLTSYGQDASLTLNELEIAMDSYIRVDRCEQDHPWYNSSAVYDGFFMRSDVPESFIRDHPEINDGLTPTNNVSSQNAGEPAYVDNISANDLINHDITSIGGNVSTSQQSIHEMKLGAMSQDQVIGLLRGLALVYRCVPAGYYAHDKAAEIADKTISYIWNAGSWTIVDPNGDLVLRGNNATVYSVPLALINSTFGNPIYGSVNWTSSNIIWQGFQIATSNCPELEIPLAAMCDCWNGQNSGLPFLNTTELGIKNNASSKNWDTFYLLYWEYLHNKPTNLLSLGKVYDQLTTAPCEGPYFYGGNLYPDNGWASTCKFQRTYDVQNTGDNASVGNFNGLDYMLLYNLYHIINLRDGNALPGYIDLIHRNVSGEYPNGFGINAGPHCTYTGNNETPLYIDGFETIESTMKIDNQCHPAPVLNCSTSCTGNVIYRAGKRISLKPGFTAKAGSFFHAYIEPFDCGNMKSGNLYGFHRPEELPAGFIDKSIVTENITAESVSKDSLINDLSLGQTITAYDEAFYAFPNPFDKTIEIHFMLTETENVHIVVRDIYGNIIQTLTDGKSAEGAHTLSFDATPFKAGTYFCSIESVSINKTIKLVKTE